MKKLFTILFFAFFGTMVAQPGGWLYNLPINVQNPNSVNAVNYQLRLTINTQSIISASMMNSNGSDIRFAGSCAGPFTFYNYWIESGINTASTVIWVKIPFIASTGSTTIFMFHGNPTAPAVSTIPGTFRGPNSSTDSVSGGTAGGATNSQRGFRFQPNQDILVTQFGKLEPTGTTRYVTLFNFTTQAIISQTQVPGSATTSYTYGNITNPIWLTSGTQYVLQLYQGSTDGYYFGTSSQIGQHLTYLDMRYCNSCTQNTFPTSVLANYHYGYPDLLYYITSTLAITPTYTFGSPLVSVSGPTAAVCSGSSLTLTTNASGTFSWNTGATASLIVVAPTSSASFYVTQNNVQGCVLTLTVNTTATVTTSSSSNSVCLGNTVSLNASGANTYSWSNGVPSGSPFTPSASAVYTVIGTNACGTVAATASVTVGTLPVVAVSSASLVCAGSQATLSGGGASTYTWLPGNGIGSNYVVSPSGNTTYTVTGTLGNCQGVTTVAIATDPIPTVNISSNSTVVCEGDAVILSATGGLSYTWTPGNLSGPTVTVNPLAPTAYSVGATNSFGCSSGTIQVIITNPNPTVVASADVYLICAGDPVNLSASGANTYIWSNSATSASTLVNPLTTTVYSVTGTSNGCINTQTVEILVFTPSVNITGPSSVCNGATATLTASGADSYSWSTGVPLPAITITPTITTIFTVSALTASGSINCPSTNSIQVTVNPNPTVSAIASRTSICKGESTDIIASGADSYLWSNSATTASITASSTLITTLLYTVTGTNIQGCSNTAVIQVKVNGCNPVSELNVQQLAINIYPNPNSGNFIVSFSSAIELNLLNELGQLVKKINLNSANHFRVNVTDVAKGVYFISGIKDNQKFNQKIVIE